MMLLLFSTSHGIWPSTVALLYALTHIAWYCSPLYMAGRVNLDSGSILHDTVSVSYIPWHIGWCCYSFLHPKAYGLVLLLRSTPLHVLLDTVVHYAWPSGLTQTAAACCMILLLFSRSPSILHDSVSLFYIPRHIAWYRCFALHPYAFSKIL